MDEQMKVAKANQELCGKEVEQVLKKYNCTLHVNDNYIDGNLVNRQFFFRYNPTVYNKSGAPM